MEKPQIKAEVAVRWAPASTGLIYFYASLDALPEFTGFGSVMPGQLANEWVLSVDPRYDFDEVLAYMKSFDKRNEGG